MAYAVRSGTTVISNLAASTQVVLLPSSLLSSLNASFPRWASAANTGGTFTFYVSGQGHSIVVAISTGGPLGTMQFSYTVDSIGSTTVSNTTPNTGSNFVFPVPGTGVTLTFAPGSYVLNSTYTVSLPGLVTIGGGGINAVTVSLGPPLLLQLAAPGHKIVVAISTGGALGTMAFTVAVDGGAPSAPVTSSAQQPMGALNEYLFTYLVPGTNTTLSFQGGGPTGNPQSPPITNFPLGATFTIAADGTLTTSGLPAGPSPFSYLEWTTLPMLTPLGSQTLTLATLADAMPGSSVLINTGLGQGWTLGTVFSDGANVFVNGKLYPTTTRAVTVPAAGGYVAPTTLPDATQYTFIGASSNGAETWFSGGGQSFYGSALSTLAGVTGLSAIETVTGGPWIVATL